MLSSHLVADNQTNWDELLLHAIAARNNSVRTGLAPNEVYIGRYPRLPKTVLEGRGVRGLQGLRRDHLNFLQLTHRIFRGFPETVSSPAGTNWKRLPGKQSKIWHSTAMWWSGGAPLGGFSSRQLATGGNLRR
ncbi:unnamed protein product [Ascophyllum nodosum]